MYVYEGLVVVGGGVGPTEVGGDSHFTVKFLLNTAAFGVGPKSIDIEARSAAFWKPS